MIDRAFNLFRVQYKCFVCISINWILHRLGAERVCLNRPLAERWIPGNDYRMLYQLHYEVSTLRIIAMWGLIATQLLRERCVIFFGRMESRCFNVFQWRSINFTNFRLIGKLWIYIKNYQIKNLSFFGTLNLYSFWAIIHVSQMAIISHLGDRSTLKPKTS